MNQKLLFYLWNNDLIISNKCILDVYIFMVDTSFIKISNIHLVATCALLPVFNDVNIVMLRVYILCLLQVDEK